jgi:3-oxoacyl-[acyl-carrier-protein] synthase II
MPPANQNSSPREVVITGLGVVSPIGIGSEAFAASLRAGRSGVRPISLFDASGFPVRIGAEVVDFEPKAYVRPRKSLKVMSREIQFGFAAADMAMTAAGLQQGQAEPDRFGVVFAAEMIYCALDEMEAVYRRCMPEGKFDFGRWGEAMMSEMFPLWMLRNLPNMVACQIAIVHDARGPNNTINLSDVSSLVAIIEAVRVIQRDAADIMIAGGVGARVNPTSMSYRGDGDLSHRNEEPAAASRPFDADRDGLVHGEGAAAFIVESREHAQKRGAPILARVLSYASAHEPLGGNPVIRLEPLTGSAIRHVLRESLSRAGMNPNDVGHVNAHGLSTITDDRYEAQAIRAVLGDVPVTAPKSFFGHLGAGCGAMELAASIVGLNSGEIPMTLNYEQPDQECPIKVVHGEPLTSNKRAALKLSSSRLGHAAAMIVAAE